MKSRMQKEIKRKKFRYNWYLILNDEGAAFGMIQTKSQSLMIILK